MIRAATAAALAIGLACCATPPETVPSDQAEPPRRSAFGRLDIGRPLDEGLAPAACAECHPRHAEEWRRSAHAAAFTDPLFVHEYGGDRFCSDCHAPRAARPELDPDLAALGVDCATCHVREGVVHGAAVSRDGTTLCATCHQFDFPGDPTLPMQDTVAESGRGDREAPCTGCHAPRVDGHTRHDFPGHRDPELLSRALYVDASATRDGWSTDVELRLRTFDASHAVPTGDVFRRLEVRVWVEGRPENAARALLGRRFDVDEDGAWHAAEDERVPPPGRGERVVALRLLDSGPVVRWAIRLHSLGPDRAFDLFGGPVEQLMTGGRIEPD